MSVTPSAFVTTSAAKPPYKDGLRASLTAVLRHRETIRKPGARIGFRRSSLYAVERTATTNRAVTARRGRRLEYFTIAWNILEGLVAVVAGAVAGSISLIGFGIDSFIEVTSGAALLWRMAVDDDIRKRERNETRALRVVGLCFLALALYLTYESVTDFLRRRAPEPSIPGIVLACVSLIVMPLLSRSKRIVARELGSAAMRADAKQTEFCTYLSAILLSGLVMNVLWGLWWADPLAALIMVPIIAKEGIEALQGTGCRDSCGNSN